jgi:hypothetical protein
MRRLILSSALLGVALATAAIAAEPASLVCTGRRSAPDPATGAMRIEEVAFRLGLDDRARRVTEDGKVMVVRVWSPRRIVYSDYNPGILAALAGGVVTTLDRTTGAWRNKWGSGVCRAAETRQGR